MPLATFNGLPWHCPDFWTEVELLLICMHNDQWNSCSSIHKCLVFQDTSLGHPTFSDFSIRLPISTQMEVHWLKQLSYDCLPMNGHFLKYFLWWTVQCYRMVFFSGGSLLKHQLVRQIWMTYSSPLNKKHDRILAHTSWVIVAHDVTEPLSHPREREPPAKLEFFTLVFGRKGATVIPWLCSLWMTSRMN
jgi:hypothetical protein